MRVSTQKPISSLWKEYDIQVQRDRYITLAKHRILTLGGYKALELPHGRSYPGLRYRCDPGRAFRQ